jgi:hypothetical protein
MVDSKKQVVQPPLIQYLPIILLTFILISLGYRKFRKFDETVETRGGKKTLTKDREAELREKQRQLEEDYICYKLIAGVDGIYPCIDCPNGFFYLYKGEVAKYGTTLHPKTRYSALKLAEERLALIQIDQGSLTAMRQLELELIYYYPILEENLKRPNLQDYLENFSSDSKPRWKLARPPKNPIDK